MIFGIIAMLAVGASWCLVGIVMGRAPKDGIDTRLIQLSSGLVSVSISLMITLLFIHQAACPRKILLFVCANLAVSGALNYLGLEAMAAGMKRGPNGAVWGIMQSALIAPFAMGIIFFDVPMTRFMGIGLLSIMGALVFFAIAKGTSGEKIQSGKSWRFYALMAFAIICAQQCMSNLPSYFPQSRSVSPVIRSLSTAFGSLTMAALCIFSGELRNNKNPIVIFRGWRNPRIWFYVIGMQMFSLVFAYTLLYPGMDKLAEINMGAICYPIMVGSCLVAFSVYAILVLHEKVSKTQIMAMILCFIGLVGLCAR